MRQAGRGRRGRRSLAREFLNLQLGIIVVVLVGVAAVSLTQSAWRLRQDEAPRARAVAEDVAATVLVRSALETSSFRGALQAYLQRVATLSGSAYVTVADEAGRVMASTVPGQEGSVLPLGDSDVLDGRAWTGVVPGPQQAAVVAHVPVLSERPGSVGTQIGFTAVGRDYPSVWRRLGDAVPDLVTYLGLACLLGVAGSLLLSRRVKRQTLGLEPAEIRELVENREAMLHGIREGVVGLDEQERVTLINDAARDLLALPADARGRTLAELGVGDRLRDILTGATSSGRDQIVLVGPRVLVLNRRAITVDGQPVGSVTTLRDRTELVSLQRELGASQHATDTLRAQAHEFSNQLHTISGLIQLGDYDEVVSYVGTLTRTRAQLAEDVTTRIGDPALAALLIAKSSQAAERGIGLRVSAESRLARVGEELSSDLVTVVGNLVDNAFDAVGSTDSGWVEVTVRDAGDSVHVVVRDSGPGVATELAQEVFTRGFTTKAATDGGQRGLGLALTKLICVRRGGAVSVRNESGAVFTASLPRPH